MYEDHIWEMSELFLAQLVIWLCQDKYATLEPGIMLQKAVQKGFGAAQVGWRGNSTDILGFHGSPRVLRILAST